MDYDAARTMDDQYDESTAAGVALRRFMHELAGTRGETDVQVVEATFRAIEAYRDLRETVEAQQETIDRLEGELAVLLERADSTESKVLDILEYALGNNPSTKGVVLSSKEVARAAGVTRRYAYDLMDEDGLPAEYPFLMTREQARQRQYGSAELDSSSYEKALVIDVEGAKASHFPLNNFNDARGQGVAE